MRRIEAARLLKEIPSVAQKIQEGSLNLSQIGELSRAIKEKEKTTGERISVLKKENLVAAIAGKSTPETQRELCSALDIEIKEPERQRGQKDFSWSSVLETLADQYLNKKAAKTSPQEFGVDGRDGEKNDAGNSIAAAVAGRGNKSLTPKMKMKILKRDQYCQFEDPLSRKKCGSTFGLQIDHRQSRWAGGGHAETV